MFVCVKCNKKTNGINKKKHKKLMPNGKIKKAPICCGVKMSLISK